MLLTLSTKPNEALSPCLGRVLIVDASHSSVRMLTELLHNIWPGKTRTASTTISGLSIAQSSDPQLIFVEYSDEGLDGLAFTRKLRRSEFSCRKAPVIMVTAQATRAAIMGARDAGVHEFLRKPFTNKDLLRRLEAVTRHPRDWVEAINYIGPDRRRFNSAGYKGARKRQIDAALEATPERVRIIQALKIVAVAPASIETDPSQVRRALNAQASELRRAGRATGDSDLAAAAGALQAYLAGLADDQALTWGGLTPHTDKLLTFMPKKDPARRTAAA